MSDLLTDDQLSHIYVEIMQGRGNHGGFLRAFAESWARADAFNIKILRGAALEIVEKYGLAKYLDNFPAVKE